MSRGATGAAAPELKLWCAFEFGDRAQQLAAMAERRNADLFEVLICQISKDGKIDVVLGKAVSVLPETELLKPICNLLHLGPLTDLTSPVLDRQDRKSTTRANSLYALGGPHVRSKREVESARSDVRFSPIATE